MGLFVAVISRSCDAANKKNVLEISNLFSEISNDLAIPAATDSVKENGISADLYPRINDTSSMIVRDLSSGSWLLSIGSWFHASGINVGEEEKLLSLILSNGAPAVSLGLDGFFNIVFYDGAKGTLTVITDIIGSCFCFYRKLNGCFVVSNSSLFLAKLSPVSVDGCGCQEFITTGIIYGNKSFFNEIKRLDAASIVTFCGDVTSERYWYIDSCPDKILRGKTTVTIFKETFCDVLKKVSSVFKSQVCDLTAGMDSRVLLAGYTATGRCPDTVVVGKDDSADVVISKKIAALLGLRHSHINPHNVFNYDNLFRLLRITDGELDLIEYLNIFNVHNELAKKYDISIGGSFGELGKGYWWELLFPKIGKREKLDTLMISEKRFAPREYINFFKECSEDDIKSGLRDELDAIVESIQTRPNTFQLDSCYLYMRMRCWQGRIASSTNRIWPCLSPLMFKSVLELLINVEPKMRIGSRLYRYFLKNCNPILANQQLENGTISAPLSLLNFWMYYPFFRGVFAKSVRKIVGNRSNDGVKKNRMAEFLFRKKLLEDCKINSLMSIDEMVVAKNMDRTVLKSFLDAARNDSNFSYNVQWQRILSLEMTMKNSNLR